MLLLKLESLVVIEFIEKVCARLLSKVELLVEYWPILKLAVKLFVNEINFEEKLSKPKAAGKDL